MSLYTFLIGVAKASVGDKNTARMARAYRESLRFGFILLFIDQDTVDLELLSLCGFLLSIVLNWFIFFI